MNCKVEAYEICNIGSLVVGDMYMHKGELHTVLRKSFDSITVFNNKRHNTEMIYTPCNMDITRVRKGYITA